MDDGAAPVEEVQAHADLAADVPDAIDGQAPVLGLADHGQQIRPEHLEDHADVAPVGPAVLEVVQEPHDAARRLRRVRLAAGARAALGPGPRLVVGDAPRVAQQVDLRLADQVALLGCGRTGQDAVTGRGEGARRVAVVARGASRGGSARGRLARTFLMLCPKTFIDAGTRSVKSITRHTTPRTMTVRKVPTFGRDISGSSGTWMGCHPPAFPPFPFPPFLPPPFLPMLLRRPRLLRLVRLRLPLRLMCWSACAVLGGAPERFSALFERLSRSH